MKKISLCMIVRDEEKTIARCLDSIKDVVDEIIIVDTGSIDKTKEIVAKYTNKIYDFEWVDDFSKARNFSFSKATKDYIMWLDADDVILPEDREKLKKLKKEMDGKIDIYQMKYNYSSDNNGNPNLVQTRERILKRDKNYKWVSPIHEVIIPTGNIEEVDIAVTHMKEEIKDINRNLKIFENMIKNGVELDERQEYCYAKELYFLQRIPEAIICYEKFINKYIEQYQDKEYLLYSALLELSDCYKRQGKIEKELETLMLILKNQVPKQECLCRIGDIFLRNKNYDIAIYWFSLAIESTEKEVNIDYQKFIPYISIGVCYFWLGEIEKAIEYNEKAGNIKQNDETYMKNKEIYDNYINNITK